jgi:dipeptidyl aminopeptidase/acylaminoacyl peptidase
MPEPIVAPYGAWKSPITSEVIAAGALGLMETALAGEQVYWLERRSAEGGRQVLVQHRADDETVDITPPGFNARTRVHEYGGGTYVVAQDRVYYVNFVDQRVYTHVPGAPPQPLTTATDMLYADGVVDPYRQRLLCVREDQTAQQRDSINTIVAIDLRGSTAGQVVLAGNDFYASPRLSPDGTRLAWLTWDHPNMPWDSTELWVGEMRHDGTLGQTTRVAGGDGEAICQPEWSPDGELYFVSDRTDWWNVYRWQHGRIDAMCPMAAEFGLPQWTFRMSTYAFATADRMVCTYTQNGVWHLAYLNTVTRQFTPVETPYTSITSLCAGPTRAVFIAGSPTMPAAVVQLDFTSGALTVLRQASTFDPGTGYLSIPRAIEFPTEPARTAYGFFYPPQNQDFIAPAGERPPLMVVSHGGPTSATSTTLNLAIQYWTSRGFGVLDVDYGGSTGYGRAYRERLKGQWGVVDVDDCCNGARYLVARGEVDGNRLIIRGGSAGGYTTLAALTFRTVFQAGASYYGISDLEALERECHKFESHYNHSLIGPYPQSIDLYRQRSPIHFTERLSCPLILFQGREDKVVPPNQADMMFAAVRAKGLPVAYLLFDGEQHGFRRAETIKRTLDVELYFYARVFQFQLAEPVEPVPIMNLV